MLIFFLFLHEKICYITWNRLVSMATSRLTRIVFEYDHGFTGRNRYSDIKKILERVNLISRFNSKSPVNLKDVEDRPFSKYKLEWANKIQSVSKLRTYRQIKTVFGTENYLLSTLSKGEKSYFAQFRCGILPLRVETGRYIGLNANETLCTSNEIEDELHLLLKCSLYDDLRRTLIAKAVETNDTFLQLSDIRKLVYMVEKHYVYVAKFILNRRKSCLYN